MVQSPAPVLGCILLILAATLRGSRTFCLKSRQPKNPRIIANWHSNCERRLERLFLWSWFMDLSPYCPRGRGAAHCHYTSDLYAAGADQRMELNLVSVMSWGLGSRGKGGCFQLLNSTFYRLLAEVLFFRQAESLRLETTRPSPLLGGL